MQVDALLDQDTEDNAIVANWLAEVSDCYYACVRAHACVGYIFIISYFTLSLRHVVIPARSYR